MLREIWVLLTLATVIAGLALQNAAVDALGALVGVACYVALLWARYSLRRLKYERIVPEDHAFPEETVSVDLRVSNRKPLPLPWIDIRERFPSSMVDEADEEFSLAGRVDVVQTDWHTSIGGDQRVTRRYELRCPDRGVYELGPTRLRSGDLFGLFSEERVEDRLTRIVVYPRTVELEELGLPSRRPFGERKGGLRVFEDPSRVAGVRDYLPGDSMRRIDWNATARIGKLQSKVYDPSSSQHLLLCVNTQTTIPAWSGSVPDVLERVISVAASIARDAYERRYSVGLIANGTFPEADRSIRIAPGRRPEQFIRILEALAVITPYVLEPLAAMLDREEHKLVLGTTIAVITGVMTVDLDATLSRLARRGHRVVVLSAWGQTGGDMLAPSVPIHDVSHITLPWRAPSTYPVAVRPSARDELRDRFAAGLAHVGHARDGGRTARLGEPGP
jgi:uncharacterized protein (DUF58 family)